MRNRPNRPLPGRRALRRASLIMVVLVTVLAVAAGAVALRAHKGDKPAAVAQSTKPIPTAASTTAPTVTTQPTAATECTGNQLSQSIVVSISQRHLWACASTAVVYDSAVITGMANLPADLTPTGTYHIYAKYTNRHLIGHDSTGSWDDYVNYWMPWLHNQYGNYGFHDATWRSSSDFGNIDPFSAQASHGCVELPLATAKWLYDWSSIGTTVTIVS